MTRSEIYNQVCKMMRQAGARPTPTNQIIADLVQRYQEDPAAFCGGWLVVVDRAAEQRGTTRGAILQAIRREIGECDAHDECRTLCKLLDTNPAWLTTPKQLIVGLADAIGV